MEQWPRPAEGRNRLLILNTERCTRKVLQHQQTWGVLEIGGARKSREEGEKIHPKWGSWYILTVIKMRRAGAGDPLQRLCFCCLVTELCPTLAISWTVARQAPLSIGLPRQEHWSGLTVPSPGDLPDPRIEPTSPALAGVSFTTESPGNPSWTNVSLSNKIQRNYKGLKISVCTGSWGKLSTTRYKKTKSLNCHFWGAGSQSRVQHMPPAPPKGRANHLRQPCSLSLGPTPTLIPYKEPALPSLSSRGAARGACSLFSLPPAAVGGLVRPRLTSSSGLSSMSAGWGRPKTLSSVQSLSCVQLFATPWPAACQASLSITNSQSLLKLMSIESVMPSNHLILCRPLRLPPSVFPSIRVFSNESVLRIRWPEYWSFSFSISPSSEYSGLISFRMESNSHRARCSHPFVNSVLVSVSGFCLIKMKFVFALFGGVCPSMLQWAHNKHLRGIIPRHPSSPRLWKRLNSMKVIGAFNFR